MPVTVNYRRAFSSDEVGNKYRVAISLLGEDHLEMKSRKHFSLYHGCCTHPFGNYPFMKKCMIVTAHIGEHGYDNISHKGSGS